MWGNSDFSVLLKNAVSEEAELKLESLVFEGGVSVLQLEEDDDTVAFENTNIIGTTRKRDANRRAASISVSKSEDDPCNFLVIQLKRMRNAHTYREMIVELFNTFP